MAKPVFIVTAGGKPVINTPGALPATPVESAGIPITLVLTLGTPMSLINEDGTAWSDDPAAAGTIGDIYLAEATGTRTRDLSSAFTGGGTYSLVSAPSGVSINATTGVLTVNTATSGKMPLTSFTVQKTSGGATATQSVKLLVGPPLWMSVPTGQLSGLDNATLTAYMTAIAGYGMQGIRMDLDWSVAEPTTSGTYVWTLYDRLFDYASAAGLKVMWIVKETPAWARATNAWNTPSASQWNSPPDDLWRYGTFCGAASDHFSGSRQVDHWEIWNEPNKTAADGFLWVGNANFKWSYPDMVWYAHSALKASRSTNIVVMGALTSVPAPGAEGDYSCASAVADIIDVMTTYHSSARPWDGYSQHVYTTPYSPLETSSWSAFPILSSCMTAIDTFTGSTVTDIYLTEFGAPTGGTVGSTDWVLTEAQQRDQLRDVLQRCTQTALRPRVKMIAWYTYGDWALFPTDHTEEHFGVIRYPNGDGVEKPVGAFMRDYGVT